MKNEYCQYASHVKQGLDEYLYCNKSFAYCKYQRICPTKKKVVHTDGYGKCSLLRAEEENMAKSSTKKVEAKKTINIVEENSAIRIDQPTKEYKTGIVLLATPNYYIVNVDGNNMKIVEENTFKQGDIINI